MAGSALDREAHTCPRAGFDREEQVYRGRSHAQQVTLINHAYDVQPHL